VWAGNSTDKSQADIYSGIRTGLIASDRAYVSFFEVEGVTGKIIDSYHMQTFSENGLNFML
jgi:hypothetical protein